MHCFAVVVFSRLYQDKLLIGKCTNYSSKVSELKENLSKHMNIGMFKNDKCSKFK